MPTPAPFPALPELAAGGLRLQPWQAGHADALHEAVRESIDTLGRWLPWCHAGYGRDDAVAWIAHCRTAWERDEAYAFGIFDADDGLLGSIGLNQLDRRNRRANLGYWIRRRAQGRGMASSAVRALAAWAFDTLALERVEIVAALANQASRRCAEKAGARFEGVARRRILLAADGPLDAAVYSLVRADLAAPPQDSPLSGCA